MKALWRLVVILWVKRPISRPLPWTEDDRQTLDLFLNGGCGKRFISKLRESAAAECFGSVYGRPEEAVSRAGYARGYCDCLGLVLRLGRSFPFLESEYAAAEDQSLPGVAGLKEQGWPGSRVGGGGAIAPNLEF